MSYVIVWRKRGKFVAQLGTLPSYTNSLEYAHRFDTREEADVVRCPESEVVLTMQEAEVIAASKGVR
jgi:hypothetical protein